MSNHSWCPLGDEVCWRDVRLLTRVVIWLIPSPLLLHCRSHLIFSLSAVRGKGQLVRHTPDVCFNHFHWANMTWLTAADCDPIGAPGRDGIIKTGEKRAPEHSLLIWINRLCCLWCGTIAFTLQRDSGRSSLVVSWKREPITELVLLPEHTSGITRFSRKR